MSKFHLYNQRKIHQGNLVLDGSQQSFQIDLAGSRESIRRILKNIMKVISETHLIVSPYVSNKHGFFKPSRVIRIFPVYKRNIGGNGKLLFTKVK